MFHKVLYVLKDVFHSLKIKRQFFYAAHFDEAGVSTIYSVDNLLNTFVRMEKEVRNVWLENDRCVLWIYLDVFAFKYFWMNCIAQNICGQGKSIEMCTSKINVTAWYICILQN